MQAVYIALLALALSVPVVAAPSATVRPDRVLTGHGNQEFIPRFALVLPNSLIVPAGKTVTISGAVAYDAIEVAGTLRCSGPIALAVTHLMVLPGGTFDCRQDGTITIRNVPIDTARDPYQFGNGLINMGRLVLRGSRVVTLFTELTADAATGATTLALNAPPSWQIGDEVLLPDLRQVIIGQGDALYYPRKDGPLFIADRTATSITLSQPLGFERASITDPDDVVQFFPRIANLTRGLTVRSESPTGTRGHVILLGHDASWDVQGTAFVGLGRTRPVNLHSATADATGAITRIGTNQVGRYTFHVHHAPGYKTTFRGNVLRDDEGVTKWGHATHATHDSVVEDSIAIGFVGSGFITEDGYEVRNVYRRNVAAYIRGNGVGANGNIDPPADSPGAEGAGFWFHGMRQVVERNEAWNNSIGYNLLYRRQVWGKVPSTPTSHPDTDFDPTTAYPISFDHNIALSNTETGWEMWSAPRYGELQYIATNLAVANNGRHGLFGGDGAEGSIRIRNLRIYAQGGRGIGIHTAAAYVRHVIIEGGEIRGTAQGMRDAADLVYFKDVKLDNVVNVEFEEFPARARFERVIHKPYKDHPPIYYSFLGRWPVWDGTTPTPNRDHGGHTNHTDDRFQVIDWQGTGQDYRLYPAQSARHLPAWPAKSHEGRSYCPVMGITMGECWDRFGIAYGGGVVDPAESIPLGGLRNVEVKAGLTPPLGPPRAVVTYPVAHEDARLGIEGPYLSVVMQITGTRVGKRVQYQIDDGPLRIVDAEDWGAPNERVQFRTTEGRATGPHTIRTWVVDATGAALASSLMTFHYAIGTTSESRASADVAIVRPDDK